MQREPVVAGMFYPADPDRCAAEVARLLQEARDTVAGGAYFAGLVPHAGWAYSGPVAAKTFVALAESGTPATIVIFGAVHSWGVDRASIYARGAWDTPLGALPVDEALAAEILRQAPGQVADNPRAHSEEHSIEVQLPFVKHLFPKARIVPLMVPPTQDAVAVGEIVARAAHPRRQEVFLLGSTDLTHYGLHYGFAPRGRGAEALEWARENDRRLLDDVVHMRAIEVVDRASRDRSACGSGAIAATVAAAGAWGATKGTLLAHTTSHDVRPVGSPSEFVGYAAVVF